MEVLHVQYLLVLYKLFHVQHLHVNQLIARDILNNHYKIVVLLIVVKQDFMNKYIKLILLHNMEVHNVNIPTDINNLEVYHVIQILVQLIVKEFGKILQNVQHRNVVQMVHICNNFMRHHQHKMVVNVKQVI